MPTCSSERSATEPVDVSLVAVDRLLAGFPAAELIGGTNGAAAVEAARGGWPVFPAVPTGPRAKAPLLPRAHPAGDPCRGECGRDGHGFHDGTTDTAQVIAWWTRHPDALVAARIPDGLIMIDTDPRHGGEANLTNLADNYGGLPATLTVESGRGDGGLHRYYLHPGGELRGRPGLPEGVDLKLPTTGYAIVPPSRHPATGHRYQWIDQRPPVPCPGWLTARLRPAPRPECTPALAVATAAGTVQGRLAGLTTAVAQSPDGNRNACLYWAARTVAELIRDGLDPSTAGTALLDAAARAGLDQQEAAGTVRSAFRAEGIRQ